MLSKNNRKLQERKLQEKQRFGFRKYSFGLASALLGVSFMLGTGSTVSAATTTPAENVAAATTSNADSGTAEADATKSEATDTKSADAAASTTDTSATETKTDTTEASNTASDSSATTDANSTSAATDNSDTKAENTTATETAKTASTESASDESKTATTDASAEKSTDSAAQTTTDVSVEKLTDSAALTTDALKASAVATTTDADSTTTVTDDAASSEGKITDEGKAKGLTDSDVDPEMSDANGASIVADQSKIPSGYEADPADDRYTFGIVSLGPLTATDGTTTYNGENNTNYYFRFSTGKDATNGQYDDTVYAQLVDGDTRKVIWEGTPTVNGAAVQVDKLKNVISDGSTHYYQLTYTATTNNGVTTKQINVNSDVGTQLSKVIYDAGNSTNTSAGTLVHVMYPDESTIRTEYIAKDAAGNETVLANYEQTGRQGYTYTASGARIFKGFDLISSPSNTTGTLSVSYKVGDIIVSTQKQLSDQLQIARINVITETNGTARILLKVAAVGASIDDIDNENIWKTILTTDPVAPGEFADNGNYDAGTHKNGAFLLYTLPQNGKLPIGVKYLTDAGFTEDQLTGYEKYLTIYGLNNRLAVGQEPVKYYYAPQGQVRINYVTSDGTVIQTPTTAYENSGNNTSYDVTGSTYRPETITVNGKTYRYVKSDKSMGTAGTTTVNGFTYNTTPSDATGTISSNNVNDVYYVYEQVTYHTEAETKDVTRTIEYYDSVTGEPIPSNLESTVTQTATLTRNKIYDDQNNFIGYGTVSADGSSYTIDDSWKVDAQTWTQQDSADLSDYGYTAPDRASVVAVTVDGDTTNVTEKVYYGHQTVPVTPENPGTPGKPINPNDPNSPVYGEETDRKNLVKDASQTIHYVGAGDDTPADNVVTQKDAFTRTVTIDKVTGKVLSYTDWTGEKTFNTVDTPVVQGYHADKKTAGGLTATVDNPDVEETVTYAPNGKLVPVDPDGNPIPGADTPTYPTDPNDPTKVVPNEPIPDVPNWTPVDPSPVTPSNPGEDTPVPYTKNETPAAKYGLTEKFVDEDGNELSPSVNKGTDYKTGDKYDVTKDAKVITGYVLVKTTDVTGTFTDSDKTAVFTYKKIGKIVPVDPKGNPIPGADTPTYKNDPDDPSKVVPNEPTPDVPGYKTDVPNVTPEDPTKDTPVPYTKDETPAAKYGLTEKFVDEDGNELSPSVNKGTDYKTGDKYDVTKDAKVITGYVLVKTTDVTGTFTDSDKTAVFTYKKIGKIVPVDPKGNPIPGADTPTYKNDPDDPSKVVPNEPTPDVPGYKTDVPNVTPEDPTKDTPVPYTQDGKGETPSTPEGPTTPSNPEVPTSPEEPSTPDTPEVPSQPQEPASPSGQKPSQPAKPASPSGQKPSQPAKPATPKQTTFTPNSGKKTPAQGKTATASQLPQTGADEEKAILLSAFGLGLVTLTSLFGLLGGKKRKH